MELSLWLKTTTQTHGKSWQVHTALILHSPKPSPSRGTATFTTQNISWHLRRGFRLPREAAAYLQLATSGLSRGAPTRRFPDLSAVKCHPVGLYLLATYSHPARRRRDTAIASDGNLDCAWATPASLLQDDGSTSMRTLYASSPLRGPRSRPLLWMPVLHSVFNRRISFLLETLPV